MLSPGLTPDRGPPIHVPFRFFFTAPIFLAAAGMALSIGPSPFPIHSYPAYGAVHLFTLGFLSMAMVGAFFQMVPVVAGLHIPESRLLAWLLHAPLTAGAAIMGLGFLLGHTSLAAAGGGLAALALALFALRFLFLLRKAERSNRTAAAMKHALLGLLLGLAAGTVAIGNHGGWWGLPDHGRWVSIHLSMVLVGWVGLLIQGVTFQVVPMFLITDEVPAFLRHHSTPLLLGLLTLRSLLVAFLPEAYPYRLAPLLFDAGIVLLLMIYAFVMLGLIAKRRRRIPDPLASFFRVSMISLIAAVGAYAAARTVLLLPMDTADPLSRAFYRIAAAFYLFGFAGTAINGMMYRIVPFLVYFHLNAKGRPDVPTMKEMLPEGTVRLQYRLHGLALIAIVSLPILSEGFSEASGFPAIHWMLQGIPGILILTSSILLLWNLTRVLVVLHENG